MKNGIKIFLVIFLSLFSFYTYALENDEDALLNKEIQDILDESRVKYKLPAISLSIKLPNSNKIQDYTSGYYSFSTKRHITRETLFQIGSITKTFTATIILKLIEENKLSRNDNLAKWLPQYPRWKDITIDNLLHHTSGIYNYSSGKSFDNLLRNNPNKYWSLSELADMAYKHLDLFKPGKKYSYTNTEYILLGLIIEKATNSSIHQIFDEYLKRYGLNSTFYSPSKYPNAVKNKIAHGYNRDGTFKFNTDVTFFSISFSQSAGAMISTPNDLIKWLDDLFKKKIITNNTLLDMTKIISEDDAKPINIKKLRVSKNLIKSNLFTELGVGEGIGLIYFKNNGITWVHAGGMLGYESLFAYNPCNGIYLTLAYNIKPKEQLVYIQIADQIFKILNSSASVIKSIKTYQHDNLLSD